MQLLALITAALVPLSVVALPATPSQAVTSSGTKTALASTSTVPADNGACDKLIAQYRNDDVNTPNGPFATVFSKYSCVMAFACRSGTETVDDAISELWTHGMSSPTPREAINEPRLSVNIFNEHSSDGTVWTQQNFIDAYYGKMNDISGPFPPSRDLVIGYWSNIAAWTGFCATKAIPYQNLADWYTFSSTVQGAVANC